MLITHIGKSINLINSPKTNVILSLTDVSIKPFVVGDRIFMKQRICCVYKITSPSKKIYVGQSVNIKDRIRKYKRLQCKGQILLYNSLKKYGWNRHKFEILNYCDKEELNELEIFYINLYQSFDSKHGLNLKEGGGAGGKISKLSMDKLIAKRKIWWDKQDKVAFAKKISHIHIKSGHKPPYHYNTSKPVLQYDKNGNFIKEWGNAKLAVLKLKLNTGSISQCANNKRKTAGGFIWKFKEKTNGIF